MSNNFRSRSRAPFNFIDGIAIKGVDISALADFNKANGSSLIGHNEGTVKDALDELFSGTGPVSLAATYPVGSVYFNSVANNNPNQLFGVGVWQLLGTGVKLTGLNQTDYNVYAWVRVS